MKVQIENIIIELQEDTLDISITYNNTTWRTDSKCHPVIRRKMGKEIYFSEAINITNEYWKSGVGKGIISKFEGFLIDDMHKNYTFYTLIWVEKATNDIYFEWIPVIEDLEDIEEVIWPVPLEFNVNRDDWYSIINLQQGMLIPNTWEIEFGEMIMKGYWGTEVGYMPWFSQIRQRKGYIAICEDYWDAGYFVEHPSKGPYTLIGNKWYPSQGKMNYKRVIKFIFVDDCDYNTMCKIYKEYARMTGIFKTLKEKEVALPSIKKLVGSSVIHTNIKRDIQKDSRFYNSKNIDSNKNVVSFNQCLNRIDKYHKAGASDLYIHLDGWADPGYENKHPDYNSASIEAGGWDGMRNFIKRLHNYGDIVGLHDQYKDYYYSAPSFDEDFVCLKPDGTFTTHALWAGGLQAYLCTTQAPYYVRRNYKNIKSNGVYIDCAYLDAFVCNAADECTNPKHKMSRRDCFNHRAKCFQYLSSQGIIPSSEEPSSWAIPDLVITHFAPYEFMLESLEKPRRGIAVPLFELVFHECIINPWMMEKSGEHEDYMLYALLNGGMPYLLREGAYPEVDGFFETEEIATVEEEIERCKCVNRLHKEIVYCEMVKHEFIDSNYLKQRTTFSNGTVVMVNFEDQTYEIGKIDNEKN